MLGWSPEEVIGLHTPELWHDPVELEETRQRLLSLGLPCSRFADILEGFPLLYPTGHSRVTFIARGGASAGPWTSWWRACRTLTARG